MKDTYCMISFICGILKQQQQPQQKQHKLTEKKIRIVVTRGGSGGTELEESGQRVQTTSDKLVLDM